LQAARLAAGAAPVELSRLDLKNWTPTPVVLQGLLLRGLAATAATVGALIVMDQVNLPETGVITKKVLGALQTLVEHDSEMLVIADSRRGCAPILQLCSR